VIPDNHDGVITHLEPDILEDKVKWVLEASGGNGIPGVPFKNQKDDALKMLHSIWQQIWKKLKPSLKDFEHYLTQKMCSCVK